MALHLGELVGTIRADDSGWRHGLQEAQLRLAGFTRMTDGTLRDMHGNVVTRSDAMGRTLGARIGRGAATAVNALKKIGPAAAGMAVGIPAAAGLTVALGALAAGAVAAGLAAGAFKLAVKPQQAAMQEAAGAADKLADAQETEARKGALAAKLKKEGSSLAEKAEKAYTSSRLATKDAEAAYQRQTAGMPKATAEAALAQAKLKKAHEEWSDSLSSTTMPVFTKGLNLLRGLLPMLTPFVKAAANAFGGFLDRVAVGVKGAGFKQWADDMAKASGGALTDFLSVIANLAKGFMGMLQAFLPVSDGVTGGLVTMTGAFARWGAGLKGSDGFADFIDLAKSGAGMLRNLALAVGKVLVALGPLIAGFLAVTGLFSKIIANTPVDVLTGVGVAVGAIVLALKAYSIYSAIYTAATSAAGVAAWEWAAAMLANPITWIIIGIVALIAVIVLIATKTTWFQQLWSTIWGGITTATAWAVEKVGSILNWFGSLPGRFGAWFGKAKDAAIIKAASLVVWLTGLPGRAIRAVASLAGRLWNSASSAFGRFKDAAILKAAQLVVWVTGLPGRIARGIGNLGSLLMEKGRNVVQGLWNGIKGMGSWLKSQIMSWARSVIPGPIAKALGISSPSKVTKEQGRWVARGLIDGLTGSSKQVRSAAQRLADIVRDSMKPGKARTKALNLINSQSKRLVALANSEVKVAAKLKVATKSLSNQLKARDKLAADVKKGVLDGANITAGGESGVSAASILATLTTKMQQAKQFAQQLATLRKKGVRSDLIAQIAQAGVEQGSGAAAALATASKSQIAQINATQGQLVGAATQAGSTAGTAMYGAGIQAAAGLVEGLKSQQKAIETQMMTIALAMQKAIRKALGIHSPSRVMAALGQYIPQGLARGIDGGRAAVDRSMSSLVTPPQSLTGLGARGVGGGLAQAGASKPIVIELQWTGPEEMKRLVRGIVRKDGRGDVQVTFGTGQR